MSSWEQLTEWKAADKVKALAVSPDGRILASGGTDNNITLWATETGKILKTLKGHEGTISTGGLTFNSTGKQIASISYSDNTARLWDIETGKNLHVLKSHTAGVTGVTFSNDDKLLATAGMDRVIILWDVESGQPLRLLRGHQNMVFGIKFLEDSRYLISGSFDRTLRLWDVQSGVTLREYQGHEAGTSVDSVYQNKVFSASNDGTVRRWSTDLPYLRRVKLPSEPASSAISTDGKSVVIGFANGSLQTYSLSDGHLLWEKEKVHKKDVQRLAFNADGSLLASGSFDNTAKLWQVRDGQLEEKQTFSGHKDAVHAVAFSPDGKTLATAGFDGRIGLFTIGTEEKRFIEKAHDAQVVTVTFNQDGTKLLSSGADGQTYLWNLKDNSKREFPKSQDVLMWSTLSPDGQRIASVGREQIVNIYSAQTGQIEHRMSGHEQTVLKAIFSPDSQQLATISGDLRFWDLSNGKELFAIRLPTEIGSSPPLWDFDFRCTPTGCWLAVPLTKGELLIYEMGRVYD